MMVDEGNDEHEHINAMNNNNKVFAHTVWKPQMTDTNMLFAHEQDVPPRLMFVSLMICVKKKKKFACICIDVFGFLLATS